MTRIYFDTEFIEDGKTIDLLSIGLVREDGATYYAEPLGVDFSKADQWVVDNVFPSLSGMQGVMKKRERIAREIIEFVGPEPEFWAYYADYDWVALCQLYGRMIDLPPGWPMFCRDLKQYAVERGLRTSQDDSIHNALRDAQWAMETHRSIELAEQGRLLASERDDLIAQGVAPADLLIPLHPEPSDSEQGEPK